MCKSECTNTVQHANYRLWIVWESTPECVDKHVRSWSCVLTLYSVCVYSTFPHSLTPPYSTSSPHVYYSTGDPVLMITVGSHNVVLCLFIDVCTYRYIQYYITTDISIRILQYNTYMILYNMYSVFIAVVQ